MNERIKRYYRDRVDNTVVDDFLWQVGKTVNGQVVDDKHIDIILSNITDALNLNITDVVLDVGCANGFLTKKISQMVSSITGVELTTELYNIAREYNSAKNITYIKDEILSFDDKDNKRKYTKIYLYEVVQHFDYIQIDKLFEKLNNLTVDGGIIFIGGILDAQKKWSYFNTEERKDMYFDSLTSGDELLGCWYEQEFFSYMAKRFNMKVVCATQNPELYTSHYRFDCVLQKR
ncbi:MAG: cyclopropane fatty-acyl-phospholipid synthase-like methyltransferase [Paraglaciecola sp.]|jgi:cyclopropane fatty-acyl-phospholipid synthase-like methyltransferase